MRNSILSYWSTFNPKMVLLYLFFFIYFSVQCDDPMYNDQKDESVFNLTQLETNALDFQANTANQFVKFLNNFEPLTIISLMFKWLKAIAFIWNHEMPVHILDKFREIFECYLFVLCH